MSRRDEPLAFPFATPSTGISHMECGMTLRDYFAAKALISQGARIPLGGPHEETVAQAKAREAYIMADAMLAERDK